MTEYENVLQGLEQILRTFVPQEQDIHEDTDLVADLDLDSLKVMKILESVEDRFDISIPLNILPDISTVGDLARALGKIEQA